MKKKTLWIITARSGSKSIINKNIKELNKIPLIAYKIKTALSISNQNDVWVITAICAVVIMLAVVAIIMFMKRRRRQANEKNGLEMIKLEEKTTLDTTTIEIE